MVVILNVWVIVVVSVCVSLAVSVTEYEPASELIGVPLHTLVPSLHDIQVTDSEDVTVITSLSASLNTLLGHV